MAGGSGDKFAHHARAVALELLGEPNAQLSTQHELRFGKQGSVSVDLEKGTFFDHGEKEGGGVLWAIQKWAGAKMEGGGAVNWMRQHGYDVEDDRPAPPPRQQAANTRIDPAGNWLPPAVPDGGRLTQTYDYRDASGGLIYQVCRFDWPDPGNPKGHSKTFLQRRPDPTKPNGWAYKVKDKITPVPYRLPELLQDIRDGFPIFVVEGEKKVDMLRALGVPATCNHGGAGKFPEDLVQHFAGADVIILPDSDPQSVNSKTKEPLFHPDGRPVFPGKDHADLVGRKLEGTARRIRVLEIPDLPPKGGVDDWLPAGGSAEKLYDLVDELAKPFVGKPYESRFGAVTWDAIDAPGKSYEYLIKGLLTKNEVSMLLGESQSGKSFVAIDLAMAVARGLPWFGLRSQQGGVIYQAGESATGVRRRRLPAYRRYYDVAREALPFVLLQHPLDLYTSDEDTEAFIDECRYWAKTFGAVPLELVIIDTFNKATPGANENDGKDMGAVLARCDRIRRETGAHVMLVHHLNSGGTKARGHTSLFANVENVITVKKVEDASDGDNRQIREWKIAKQKDGEDGVTKRFVLKGVQIGTDEDGDPITSCVVMPPGGQTMEERFPEGINLGGNNATILRAVYEAIGSKGVLAPSDLGLARGAMAVERRLLAEVAAGVLGDDPDDIQPGETEEKAATRRAGSRRAAIRRAREYLYKAGVIGLSNEWVWLTGAVRIKGFGPPPGLGEGEAKSAYSRPSRSKKGKGDGGPPPQELPPPDLDLPFDPEDYR